MDLSVQVGDVGDASHLIHVLDEASRAAKERGDDNASELLAGVANQIRGQIQGQST